MTVEEYIVNRRSLPNFYGRVKINRKSLNKEKVVNLSTENLIHDIVFDIKGELKANGYDISYGSLFAEVESIRVNLRSIVEYFYDNGFDEDKFLHSDLFKKYWKTNCPDDWEHGIKTKNGLLYFRKCCLFLEKDGFSIEFND